MPLFGARGPLKNTVPSTQREPDSQDTVLEPLTKGLRLRLYLNMIFKREIWEKLNEE